MTPRLENVKGLAELQKFLNQLPVKMERNVMRGALRQGMNVIKPVAQGNIHSVSGKLAAGLKVGTRGRGGQVVSRLRATGPHGFIAKWVEFGTSAHTIPAKDGGWLSFGGIFAKSVSHPGARPKPFMRPAMDSHATQAIHAAANYIRRRLMKKHGLDTRNIRLAGDE